MGFCGLDRRRQPLHGDEVRACWEDGAVALAPEPSIPGLLDLLTVHAVSHPETDARETASVPPEREPPGVHRLRSASPSRDWVEVDVVPLEANAVEAQPVEA